MIVPKSEIFLVLRQYNPWWESGEIPEIPAWRRVVFRELISWIHKPPSQRAVILTGARQTGKTTLFLQSIEYLIDKGVNPDHILYVTFDHPILKLIGLDQLMGIWREMHPENTSAEYYIFLDEVQFVDNWQTWIKHQVDFNKSNHIAATGSAVPINMDSLESGVGRWHTIKLPTLSFFEYLEIKNIKFPEIPSVTSLFKIFDWPENVRIKISNDSRVLVGHFHEYILRGGFPQIALMENLITAQKLLREDVVDKVLKRDMTALFGVRRILELEKTFLYLCLHDGGILDMAKLCENLELKKPTVTKFIDLLENAHLIYRLPPHGYGKEILRGRYKVYLADAAIAGSVLMKGRALLEDQTRLGAAVETAFFKHVFTRYYQSSVGFSYWRGKQDLEVDIIAEVEGRIIPFEIKYSHSPVKLGDVKGLIQLCKARNIYHAYAVTGDINDFDILSFGDLDIKILKIPAPLACYWLSRSEIEAI